VIAERGYADATVESIAEEAGFSTGAVYSNFPGKEELFLQLMLWHREAALGRQSQALTQLLASSPELGLATFTERFTQLADSREASLEAEFWLFATRHPRAMAALQERYRARLDVLQAALLEALPERFRGREAEARQVAEVMSATFQGLIRQRRIDPASVPQELFTRALRWVAAGVMADPALEVPGQQE
jgi:AcrR family transcriptional regulator